MKGTKLTFDRERAWRLAIEEEAVRRLARDGGDEATVAEALGLPVHVVRGTAIECGLGKAPESVSGATDFVVGLHMEGRWPKSRIGEALGVTTERIRQVVAAAVPKADRDGVAAELRSVRRAEKRAYARWRRHNAPPNWSCERCGKKEFREGSDRDRVVCSNRCRDARRIEDAAIVRFGLPVTIDRDGCAKVSPIIDGRRKSLRLARYFVAHVQGREVPKGKIVHLNSDDPLDVREETVEVLTWRELRRRQAERRKRRRDKEGRADSTAAQSPGLTHTHERTTHMQANGTKAQKKKKKSTNRKLTDAQRAETMKMLDELGDSFNLSDREVAKVAGITREGIRYVRRNDGATSPATYKRLRKNMRLVRKGQWGQETGSKKGNGKTSVTTQGNGVTPASTTHAATTTEEKDTAAPANRAAFGWMSEVQELLLKAAEIVEREAEKVPEGFRAPYESKRDALMSAVDDFAT